jgi:hypothetical protein
MTVFVPQEHWFTVKHAFDSKEGWTGQDFLNGRPRQRQQRALKFSQVCTQSLIDGLTRLRAALMSALLHMDILKKQPGLLFHSSSRTGCAGCRKSWPFKRAFFLQRCPRRHRYHSLLNTTSSSGVKQLTPFPPLSRIAVFLQTCRSFFHKAESGDRQARTS